MNFSPKTTLTATGADQAVTVSRGQVLWVRAIGVECEVRDVAGSADKFVIPADTPFPLGPSLGQTLYLRATAGATIYIAQG